MPLKLKMLPPGLAPAGQQQRPAPAPRGGKAGGGKVPVPRPREKDVQKAVLQYLNLLGWLVWRANSGATTAVYKGKTRFIRFASIEGLSDLVAVAPPDGRVVCIEVKRDAKAKPTAKQLAFLASVQQAGGLAIVTFSVADLEDKLKLEGLL